MCILIYWRLGVCKFFFSQKIHIFHHYISFCHFALDLKRHTGRACDGQSMVAWCRSFGWRKDLKDFNHKKCRKTAGPHIEMNRSLRPGFFIIFRQKNTSQEWSLTAKFVSPCWNKRTPNQFLKSYRLPPKATDDLQKNKQLQPWGHMEHDLGRWFVPWAATRSPERPHLDISGDEWGGSCECSYGCSCIHFPRNGEPRSY